MIKGRSKKHITALMVLVVFAVFAACVLSVLLTGAGTYSRIADRNGEYYSRSAAERYITTRIRQADAEGAVETGKFQGLPCVMLRQEYGGEEYITRIYCLDGYLCELFSPADSFLTPDAGEKILPLEGMNVRDEKGLLALTLEYEDASGGEVRVLLRSREGDSP